LIITIVCDVLGEENNGTTVAAMNLINAMKEFGHEVRVLCGNESHRGEEGYYVTHEYRFVPPLSAYIAKVGVELSAPDKKVINEALQGADAVHIMTPFILGIAALRSAMKMELPITAGFHCQAENVTSHLHLMDVEAANNLIYKAMYDLFYKNVDCIHYPTQFIRNTFEKHVGETKGVVISNGVSSMFCRNRKEKPDSFLGRFVILTSGRYGKEKSQHILLEAVQMSKHENDIQVILAGQGPLHDKLEKTGAALTNPPVMKLFERAELVNVINYSDLYVHAAEVDLEAIACLEAMACGLVPVIAESPKCATKKFALSENNLFKVNDPASLASKIDYWIEHDEARKQAEISYQKYAQQFRLENCMRQMEQMIINCARQCATERYMSC